MRRGVQPRGRAERQSPPREVFAAIFHVRDAAPVKELLADLHPRPRRKRSASGDKRGGRMMSGKGSRARDAEHPPLYLVGDDHLIILAPTRASANAMRRAVERAMGDAVKHVETRSIKPPRKPMK